MEANPSVQTNNEFMDTSKHSITRSVIKFYDSNNQNWGAMSDQETGYFLVWFRLSS